MAAIQHRPSMGMQPPQASPGHAPPGQQPMGQPPMNTPAMKIPYPLMPHVHLKSHQQYPITRDLNIPMIVSYLRDAPRVVNDLQPVEWTYLNPPRDGTVMLVWQAPGQINYASDGYWWCDVETQARRRHGNYNLEIFSQRVGYVPGESLATHSRQRFRLTPNGPPNVAPCDPCLWIVRYFRADADQHIPVNRVPQNTPMAGVMQQRAQIEKAGWLVRKPFMLTDSSNWPTLPVPEGLMRPRTASQTTEDIHAAKRLRYEDGKADDDAIEMIEVNPPPGEDDDKDIFDVVTPRDISVHRYARHNEWMEELFSSPYAISHIKAASLGLGRGGALRKLTKNFYQPALDERLIRQPEKYTGGDDVAKEYTDEEIDRLDADVQAYIAKTQTEMEEMDSLHERTLANIRDKSLFGDAESRLRYAVLEQGREDPLELEQGSHFNYSSLQHRKPERLEAVVNEVCEKIGLQPKAQPQFRCVSKGGYQEPPSPPASPPPEEEDEVEDEDEDEDAAMGDGDSQFVDFAGTASARSGLSDQPHPDAAQASSAGEGEDGWVVVDKATVQADSIASGAAPAPLSTPAGQPGLAASGESSDFGASLDFGDLPEGEEAGADEAEDDEEEEAQDQGQEDVDEAGDAEDEDAAAADEPNDDATMDSAFADAMAPADHDSEEPSGEAAAAEAQSAADKEPSAVLASSDVATAAAAGAAAAATLVSSEAAVAPASDEVAPATAVVEAATTVPPTAPASAPLDDVEMQDSTVDSTAAAANEDSSAPLESTAAAVTGVGAESGEGQGPGQGESMQFVEDSAFGDAFHQSEAGEAE